MSEPLLRCVKIRKSYVLGRTLLPVLRGVNLSIKPGQLVAITGTSGSGKSTLLHVMSGLDVPQRGQVFYRGQSIFEPEGIRDVPTSHDALVAGGEAAEAQSPKQGAATTTEPPPANLRQMAARRNRFLNSAFGFVFQFYHLLPEFDVLENVLLPQMVGRSIGGWLTRRGESAARAHELLARVGLSDRLRHRPNELSGGERQRVAIARALMNEPEVLFADEPTGNLDASTGRGIFSLLKGLNEIGQTVVMVTHDRDLAREADEVVRLMDGLVK
ncbi:MAG: ABC transporter ATP-binding protein [Planctomycetota bacterium]